MRYAPLPFRPPPLPDEILSSWLSRVARANHCDTRELCRYVRFDDGFPPDAVDDDCAVDWRRLQRTLRIDARAAAAGRATGFARQSRPCSACLSGSRSGLSLVHREGQLGDRVVALALGRRSPLQGLRRCVDADHRATDDERRHHNDAAPKRATAGGAFINQALSTGDQVALRRARLAVRLGAAILDKSVFWTLLFSSDRYVRQFLLAAVAASRHRPIKTAVLATAELEDRGRWRFHQAFPERARAARLVNVLAAERAASVRSVEPQWDAVDAPMADRFKVAAQWAMADLGAGACERALFRRADELLRSMRGSNAQECEGRTIRNPMN